MRIVVFGGAGFIGSAVCRMMVAERGATILNIDKLTATSSLASLKPIAQSPRYSFRKADICDRERIAALLHAFAPDAIVHAAAERQSAARIGGAACAIETNVLGTWRVLEAAREYWETLRPSAQQKFRLLSVSATDSHASPAAACKAGADELVTAWHKSYGLPTIVSKAAPTFGPYQFPSEMVARATIAAIDRNETTAATGEVRDWLYVEDHVRALALMLDKGTPGATYHTAGRGNVSAAELAERVALLVDRHGAPSGTKSGNKPRIDTLRCKPEVLVAATAASSASLERDTGWRAEDSIDTALSKTVRWYISNEAWWRPLSAAEAAGHDFGVLRIA